MTGLHRISARHRPECLTVTFHAATDVAAANKQGLYGAFWPDAPQYDLSEILTNQEKIMTEVSQAQADVNAAVAAFTSAESTISTVAADLGTVLANVQAQLAAFQADNRDRGHNRAGHRGCGYLGAAGRVAGC